MDKDHLIDLISNSLLYESKDSESTKNLCDFKNYLKRLNIIVKMMLTIKQVITGKKKVELPVLNNISPGSCPIPSFLM